MAKFSTIANCGDQNGMRQYQSEIESARLEKLEIRTKVWQKGQIRNDLIIRSTPLAE
jgi:hypothetical protein